MMRHVIIVFHVPKPDSSLWVFNLDFRAFRMSLSLIFIQDFILADIHIQHFPHALLVIIGANLLNAVSNMFLKILHALRQSFTKLGRVIRSAIPSCNCFFKQVHVIKFLDASNNFVISDTTGNRWCP